MKINFNIKLVALVVAGIFGVILFSQLGQDESYFLQEIPKENLVPSAVIIDQLSEELPNTYFEKQSQKIFQDAGYKVDYIKSQNVTVDFYKTLPSMGYQHVVLRSHAIAKQDTENPVTLFTGESYSTDKYITEQLLGHVKRAAPLGTVLFNSPGPSDAWVVENDSSKSIILPPNYEAFAEEEYFAITPKLVDELMVGQFPSSTIILGGCSTLSNPTMAKSLVNRGASLIVGWDDVVSSVDNDKALLILIEEIISKNNNIEYAIESYSNQTKHIPKNWDAHLKYYTENELQ